MNIGFANFMLILSKVFGDFSINAIDELETLATSLETGLCPSGFVLSVWTEIEILALFKSISK